MTKHHLLSISKIIIPIAIFYSIGTFLFGGLDSLKDIHMDFNGYLLCLSFISLIVFYFGLALIWFFITDINGCALGLYRTLALWAYSNLGKYVPGKVFSYAILYHSYSKNDISYKRLHFCFYLELVCSLIASCLILLISIFFINNAFIEHYRIAVLVFMAGLIILSHPSILELLSNVFMRLLKKDPVKLDIKFTTILIIILFYIIDWFVFGLSFYLMIKSFYAISINKFFYLTGSFSLAGLIGFLAFFTPSGLGVREGVLILFLKHITPISIAGIISVSSRLLLIIAELTCFLIAFIYQTYLNKFKQVK